MPTADFGKLEKVLRLGEGRRMKRLAAQADYIATLEPDFQKLSDDELRGTTVALRERLENGEPLDELLFEAYAAVREARWRESQQRMFDVQMMGGIVLHEGDIAEMKTGEGKTFVAATALFLNALPGTGVHLVTTTTIWPSATPSGMGRVFERLGMTDGYIQNMMPFAERQEAYAADITYGTNSEFGFDYLRDNMAVSKEGLVQRSHSFAIVDEVDSILIDEARTPLIISGEPETAATTYYDFARIVKELVGAPATRKSEKGEDETELSGADYLYDEKHKTVSPAQTAIDKIERALRIENLYDPTNVQLVNHLIQSLKAESLYQRDVDYVVQDGEVKIVDEFTGRIMEGRRWSEGLHQAVEAKEGVKIQEENVTLATITLQNYFRLYEKLAGMTGTAKTEEKEFVEIYNLHVVEIPTNVPVTRRDENDFIFKTKEAKFSAVIDDIKERYENGQPVLVGTIAVETSEYLSELMTRRGIPHNVLNAKEHERESEIIKDAGQQRAVTIATNMAGRGVDIKLGEGVVDLGGLYVLATERHESRRIDNQLRGRSGRQGDPGLTRFYLSGEDDLVRLFAGDRIKNIMERFKLPDDQPMEAKILSNQIENAQKKVEEQNFVARKNVLKYDDVMNTQRQVIYEQRRRVLDGDDLSERGARMDPRGRRDERHQRDRGRVLRGWDLAALIAQMQGLYGTDITVEELREEVELDTRGADRGVRRGRARDLRREGEAVRARADARDRALRDAPGRRLALARAPRVDGLSPRGHPPARDGAEGPARRVPRRGPRDVRGARPGDPRGGRAHALPRADRAQEPASQSRSGERQPPVRSTRRPRARRRSPRPAVPPVPSERRSRRRPGARPPRRPRSTSTRMSAATTRAGAAAARSSRSATAPDGPWPGGSRRARR